MAQIFASSDDGKTWHKRGPAVEGSGFDYVYANADGVWIVGSHIAEGPVDPFLLVPAGREGWLLRTIYDGPAELQGAELRGPNSVLVWMTHSTVHDEARRGRVYLHRSDDGGMTWKVRPSTGPTGHPLGLFAPITKRSGDWQLTDRDDGGFDIQNHASGSWQTVAAFPWQPCPDPLGGDPSNAAP